MKVLRETLRRKFLRMFGYSVQELRPGMRLRYLYTNDFSITVRLIISRTADKKILNVELSKPLTEAINKYEQYLASDAVTITKKQVAMLQAEISSLFNDEYDTVYIPSGRSMLAVMSNYMRPFSFQ